MYRSHVFSDYAIKGAWAAGNSLIIDTGKTFVDLDSAKLEAMMDYLQWYMMTGPKSPGPIPRGHPAFNTNHPDTVTKKQILWAKNRLGDKAYEREIDSVITAFHAHYDSTLRLSRMERIMNDLQKNRLRMYSSKSLKAVEPEPDQ